MRRNTHSKICMSLLILAAVCALGGVALSPMAQPDAVFGSREAPQIAPRADAFHNSERGVSLYFRMRDEALLAREERFVTLPADKRLEQALVEELIDGPGPNALDVTGLFNPNTRVVSVSVEGATLVVTLSREFLDTPIDAPFDWANNAGWRAEVTLRRRLALMSIVGTVTEYSDVTNVQLLVRKSDAEIKGERIARSELYENASPNAQLGPVARDEAMLMSHHTAAEIVLECWKQKNFTRLYRYVAERPTEETFLQQMLSTQRSLISYALSAGTVSSDGKSAVLVAQLSLNRQGNTERVENYPVRMTLDGGIWKISHDALMRLMEAD